MVGVDLIRGFAMNYDKPVTPVLKVAGMNYNKHNATSFLNIALSWDLSSSDLVVPKLLLSTYKLL